MAYCGKVKAAGNNSTREKFEYQYMAKDEVEILLSYSSACFKQKP